jgi:hypothetical protein
MWRRWHAGGQEDTDRGRRNYCGAWAESGVIQTPLISPSLCIAFTSPCSASSSSHSIVLCLNPSSLAFFFSNKMSPCRLRSSHSMDLSALFYLHPNPSNEYHFYTISSIHQWLNEICPKHHTTLSDFRWIDQDPYRHSLSNPNPNIMIVRVHR